MKTKMKAEWCDVCCRAMAVKQQVHKQVVEKQTQAARKHGNLRQGGRNTRVLATLAGTGAQSQKYGEEPEDEQPRILKQRSGDKQERIQRLYR